MASSYFSNILSQTTSHYKSIRRTLLANEDDGDTEDDSHITRVLRAYYTEKGRPFPPWLPPDPNERRSMTPQNSFTQPIAGYVNNLTGRNQPSNLPPPNPSSQRSSLSDLWDAPNAAPVQPQSLRAARKPAAPVPAPTSSYSGNLAPPTQARPLPSQRAGSYQTMQNQAPSRPSFEPTPPSSSGGGTAQDRLKARLWGSGGGRSASPSNGGYQPPSSSGNPYASGGGYGR